MLIFGQDSGTHLFALSLNENTFPTNIFATKESGIYFLHLPLYFQARRPISMEHIQNEREWNTSSVMTLNLQTRMHISNKYIWSKKKKRNIFPVSSILFPRKKTCFCGIYYSKQKWVEFSVMTYTSKGGCMFPMNVLVK